MNQNLFTQFHREYELQRREKVFKEKQKLSPKVLLNDEDFEITIDDIPIKIKPPVLPVNPVPIQKQPKPDKTSKELW